MFDTMTFTKILGGFAGAFLVFLLGKFFAEEIYAMGGGHGDDVKAYVINIDSADSGAGETEELDFAALYAAADLDKGAKVFGKCKACHKPEDGANSTGPFLFGVVGRQVDTAPGFAYSGALLQAADVWTPEHLFAFLENPKASAPGTTMSFAGLKKPADRANLIAYLDMLDGTMTVVAGDAPAAAEEAAPEDTASEDTAPEAEEAAQP